MRLAELRTSDGRALLRGRVVDPGAAWARGTEQFARKVLGAQDEGKIRVEVEQLHRLPIEVEKDAVHFDTPCGRSAVAQRG